MKINIKILYFLPILLFFLTNVHASIQADLEEIEKNKIYTYDTTGHPKAKEVRLTIPYLQSWDAVEGDRPNIVKKFQKIYQQKTITTVIYIKNAPTNKKYTSSQVKSENFRKNLIESTGENIEYISSGSTKIEGEDAIWSIYKQNFSFPSVELNMFCLSYSFYISNKHVLIAHAVGGLSSDKTVKTTFDEYTKLFELITSRITLPEKWENKKN